ncbi:MAG TPA: MFS transporter [Gammaproteobacteria bacterium]|nr:MFS transporter [Gammaproteobacteria bacterium]
MTERQLNTAAAADGGQRTAKTAFSILAAISFCHLLNDMMQSLLPAIYPILKANYGLDFGQIGILTFTFQVTASLLQPVIGLYTDHRPKPYSLAIGMGVTLIGLVLLSRAGSYAALLLAAALVGIGSAVLHPESSRVARMAAGGQPGLAQSLFQVGGNVGSAIGPLLAAFIVLRYGQSSVAWFAIAAILGILLLIRVGHWYKVHGLARMKSHTARKERQNTWSRRQVTSAFVVLVALIFSKFFYTATMTSYYTFYLIEQFDVSVRSAQIHLFVFLAAVAFGTVAGGSLGDRFGRKFVIWGSILGVLPFTVLLPYANLFWTGVLSVPIGVILASAFPAIVVYGQELMPFKVGTVAGLFFGLAFGLGGIGAAVVGHLADVTSIQFVFYLCGFLPALGLLAAFLPHIETASRRRQASAPAVDITGGTGT